MLQLWEPEMDKSLISTPSSAITPLESLISPSASEDKRTMELLYHKPSHKPDESSGIDASNCDEQLKFIDNE